MADLSQIEWLEVEHRQGEHDAGISPRCPLCKGPTQQPRTPTECPVCRSGDIEHARLLTVPEVASRRDAHPHTVRAAIKAGNLPAKRVGRAYVVTVPDADSWTPRQPGRPRSLGGTP